jgi:hypothetical protein
MLFWLDKRRQLSLSSAFGGFMRANVSQKLHKNAGLCKFCKKSQKIWLKAAESGTYGSAAGKGLSMSEGETGCQAEGIGDEVDGG